MNARVLAIAMLGLIALATVPTAAADDPASSAFYTVGSVVVCSLAGVDATLVNTFKPWTGGQYPGRPTLVLIIQDLGPNGGTGRTLTSVGRTLGQTWDTAYGTALAALATAEYESNRTQATIAGHVVTAVETAHNLKCWATHGVLFPAWDAWVKPHGDCLLTPGGPFLAWLFKSIQPPPRVPTMPPCY